MALAPFHSDPPLVTLENTFVQPFNNAIATARTCYSSRVIYAGEMEKSERSIALRDRIAKSTYDAGHHTTIQHATFQFVLQRVSRQFIWSFLHAHPFYNSEQVSQRYVEVKAGRVTIPHLGEADHALYVATIERQMTDYHHLIELLTPDVGDEYFDIFPARRRRMDAGDKAPTRTIQKKAQEIARYVLPVATHAHLYHTISGLTLHRYHRLAHAFDTPEEQVYVVDQMVKAVSDVDPLYFATVEDTIPMEDTPEFIAFSSLRDGVEGPASRAFIDSFDASLGDRMSLLIDYKVNAESTMAQAVRTIFGATEDELPDHDALRLALSPEINSLFGEALNLTTMSKLSRAMHHPHYTFRKKLSHTADSQAQRHRMTPGSRPILAAHIVPDKPDYITPDLVLRNPRAAEVYRSSMEASWEALAKLRENGVSAEVAHYLLPNAVAIRFEESGDLSALHHKWTLRLCYNAQEEIWRCSKEEVEQVAEVHPAIGRYIGAPCHLRLASGTRPYCPEGSRYCGVPVWKLTISEMERLL
jgi:thymidylate synthase ThyX